MTDNKIIKALECCVEETSEACFKCELRLTPYPACKTMINKHALNLINRQKAEIEKLKAIGKDEIEYRKALEKHSVSLAIKEFAAKVEQKCLDIGIYPACVRWAVEETKREMTEKDDESISSL